MKHRTVFKRVSKAIRYCFGFFIATLCDWLENLTTLDQPIRSKTKTNRDLFHAFSRAWRRLQVFASSSDWFIGLSASVVIGQSNYSVSFWFYDTQLKIALKKFFLIIHTPFALNTLKLF